MKELLKKLASHFPPSLQHALKRIYFALQIRLDRFRTGEPEFEYAGTILKSGDWAIDIGANIGHYTLQFSKLVGPLGRVIAFEPVPETFDLLSSNIWTKRLENVTLINAAASDCTRLSGLDVPMFDSGLKNFYMANLTSNRQGPQVLCIQVDALRLDHNISLVKIDAEGHDFVVLQGMKELLRRDRPVVIIEENSVDVRNFMTDLGYLGIRLSDSHNIVFRNHL